jgi:hypothetical protein
MWSTVPPIIAICRPASSAGSTGGHGPGVHVLREHGRRRRRQQQLPWLHAAPAPTRHCCGPHTAAACAQSNAPCTHTRARACAGVYCWPDSGPSSCLYRFALPSITAPGGPRLSACLRSSAVWCDTPAAAHVVRACSLHGCVLHALQPASTQPHHAPHARHTIRAHLLLLPLDGRREACYVKLLARRQPPAFLALVLLLPAACRAPAACQAVRGAHRQRARGFGV